MVIDRNRGQIVGGRVEHMIKFGTAITIDRHRGGIGEAPFAQAVITYTVD